MTEMLQQPRDLLNEDAAQLEHEREIYLELNDRAIGALVLESYQQQRPYLDGSDRLPANTCNE